MKSRLIGILIIVSMGIAIAYFSITENNLPPVYNPNQLDSKLVEPAMHSIMSGHRIAPFALTNQFGKAITEKDFQGKIYVADFFFTTCPGICKSMAVQLKRVQDENKDKNDFMILSHTVQPEVDSPSVMLEYARQHGADPSIWQFATAEREEIFRLARRVYFAATLKEGHEEEMVHTENFVLVDKEKRIRGIYDGTSEEEVDRLIADIEKLRAFYD